MIRHKRRLQLKGNSIAEHVALTGHFPIQLYQEPSKK